MGTIKNIRTKIVIVELTVNKIIGSGSSIYEIIGEMAEKKRPNMLQVPMAVAANSVGNMKEFPE